MSRALLRKAIEPLPLRLRDDVMGYASFIEQVAGERAENMGLRLDKPQRDRVVFLASVMHLRDIVSGQLALVQATSREFDGVDGGGQVKGLEVGGDDIHPGSKYGRDLRRLNNELTSLLTGAGVPAYASRLSDAIELVADGGERRPDRAG